MGYSNEIFTEDLSNEELKNILYDLGMSELVDMYTSFCEYACDNGSYAPWLYTYKDLQELFSSWVDINGKPNITLIFSDIDYYHLDRIDFDENKVYGLIKLTSKVSNFTSESFQSYSESEAYKIILTDEFIDWVRETYETL